MEREKKVGFHAQALQAAVEAIAMDENAIMHDEATGEFRSNEDPNADRNVYAAAFRAWADGKIDATSDEIFAAITEILDYGALQQ